MSSTSRMMAIIASAIGVAMAGMLACDTDADTTANHTRTGAIGSASHLNPPGTEPIDWAPTEQDGEELIHPEGAIPVDPLRLDGHVTCAGLGLGTVSTHVTKPHANVFPTTGEEGAFGWRMIALEGGHSAKLWRCCSTFFGEGMSFFFGSTTPIDAFIVHGIPRDPETDRGPASNVYKYDPPTRASNLLFAPQDNAPDEFLIYEVTGVELCYTLRKTDGGSSGSSGGSSSGGSSGKTW